LQQAGRTHFYLLFLIAGEFAKKVALLTIDLVSGSKSVPPTEDRSTHLNTEVPMHPIVAKLIIAFLVGLTLSVRFQPLFHQCQKIN
jgi:hypothetical protein